jgi:membrane associated rhomboid family serine protease
MQAFRPGGFNLLPPVIKNLLIINGLFFVATYTLYNINYINLWEMLRLYFPASSEFKPYQIFTHMFMHGDIGHLFFNMFALWMFGNTLENLWGGKKFLTYYMLTGLGATAIYMGIHSIEFFDLVSQVDSETYKEIRNESYAVYSSGKAYTNPLFNQLALVMNSSVLGASGAVFGILLAFGMTFPNATVYLYFAIPIKVKYFVAGYGALELLNGIFNTNDGIAHTAHLGGMIVGYFLIRYWRKNEFRPQ